MNTHDTPLDEVRRILANDKQRARVESACAHGEHWWVHPFGVKGMLRYCDKCGVPKELFETRQKEKKP